jgi:hypothetical protein
MFARLGLGALLSVSVSAWPTLPDSTLQNVSEIAWEGPEYIASYIGSPSIVRCSNGSLLASHDYFGTQSRQVGVVSVLRSDTNGQGGWVAVGAAAPMYWATLFTRSGDSAVYLMGVENDGTTSKPNQINIARSDDCGATWTASVALTKSNISFSTGPTPVLQHAGRIWRAYEWNTSPGWAVGYSAVLFSAPDNATDLLDPASWTLGEPLAFSSVANQVPASWSNPAVISSFGWLEGNAVVPVNASDPGMHIMLRVNSLPAANKAALLYAAGPTAPLQLVSFVEFPGGMTKFTVRRDPVTGVYVTLSNNIVDASVTLPPMCSSFGPVQGPLPPCGMGQLIQCEDASKITCLWTHALARNNLTMSVSADLMNWTVVLNVLASDIGQPSWIQLLFEGFQYVDWIFDGPEGVDLSAVVRTAYRGANCFHNSNRILYKYIPDFRQHIPASILRAGQRYRTAVLDAGAH